MKKILLSLVLASLPSLASANLVVNGSFELDNQAANSWHIYSNLTGWTGGQNGIELRNNVAGAASDGNNYVELDTTGNSSMFQTINSTVIGTSYDLTFDFSPREGVSAASNKIQVWWNNDLLTAPPLTGNGGVGNNWSSYSFSVMGSGNDTLEFRAIGTNDSLGGSLDNVSLTAAVPEPETYGMMLVGLGLIGFATRSRKKFQA